MEDLIIVGPRGGWDQYPPSLSGALELRPSTSRRKKRVRAPLRFCAVLGRAVRGTVASFLHDNSRELCSGLRDSGTSDFPLYFPFVPDFSMLPAAGYIAVQLVAQGSEQGWQVPVQRTAGASMRCSSSWPTSLITLGSITPKQFVLLFAIMAASCSMPTSTASLARSTISSAATRAFVGLAPAPRLPHAHSLRYPILRQVAWRRACLEHQKIPFGI